ncbi:hypothetical protein V1511DRAFT_485548 [Dipodascopsis uninucleata]
MTEKSNQIYKATYSGVPVYEFLCRSVAVMRRRSDAWMNATQILKVANFDKPQRTRILEREVQKGVHEKIQGGYGKYQGTWVPLERGRDIAIQYRVEEVLRPIFDFRPSSTSPPPAPKHITASSVRGRASRGGTVAGLPRSASQAHSKRAAAVAAAAASVATRSSYARGRGRGRGRARGSFSRVGRATKTEEAEDDSMELDDDIPDEEDNDNLAGASEEEFENTTNGLEGAVEIDEGDASEIEVNNMHSEVSTRRRLKRGFSGHLSQHRLLQEVMTDEESISGDSASLSSHSSSASDSDSDDTANGSAARDEHGLPNRKRRADNSLMASAHTSLAVAQIEYSNRLLDYFMAPDDDNIPDFVLKPPDNFDVNAAIDDEGHTAFHWASAIGHIKMMEILLQAGASINAVNNDGETPLVRAITFTNNYDKRTFPKVVRMLENTIFQVDRYGRTVLHHIAGTTTSRSKLSAARYYIETIMSKLMEIHTIDTLERFLNQQDANGDTALHIAACNGARRCVKVLLGYSANTQLANKQGLTAQGYIYSNGGMVKSSSSPMQLGADHRYHRSSGTGGLHSRRSTNGIGGSVVMQLPASGSPAAPRVIAQPHASEAAIQATQKVVPAMSSHLEALATAYDSELRDKEADLAQAMQLLENVRKEIRACEAAERELQAEAGLNKDGRDEKLAAEERVRARCEEMRRLMEHTQQRDLIKLVREETERYQKQGTNAAKQDSEEGNVTAEKLAKELYILQVQRRKMVDEIVELWAGAGVGEKMNDYRRLISLSCGIKVEEIDNLLDGIAQALSGDSGE